MGNQESRQLSLSQNGRSSYGNVSNRNSNQVQSKKEDIQSVLSNMQLNQVQINNFIQQSKQYDNYQSCSNKVESQILFICLDCTKNKQYGQCEQCFVSSNHQNHRYYTLKSQFETFCACGTNRNGQSNYSCKDHTIKKVINDSSEAQQLYLSTLDHVLLSKVDQYFQKQITNIEITSQRKQNSYFQQLYFV